MTFTESITARNDQQLDMFALIELVHANALREGWIDISLDLEGRSWNLLAWCPACQKEHAEEECRLNTPKQTEPKSKPTSLFPLDND